MSSGNNSAAIEAARERTRKLAEANKRPASCSDVIGRGGEQIGAIQKSCSCKVQMAQSSHDGQSRKCILRGTALAIKNAKDMILDVISKSEGRPPPVGRSGNQVTEEMLIPGQMCGYIIGKSGDTIKKLQEKSGCKIALIQDSTMSTDSPKPLRITGDPDRIEFAKRMVNEYIQKDTNARPAGQVNNLYGHQQQQHQQQQHLAVQETTGDVFYMHVPKGKTGLVIGKDGVTIKEINKNSGAHVELLKNDDYAQENEKVFVIKGTPEQIHLAQHLIRMKIAPDTPLGPIPVFDSMQSRNASAHSGAEGAGSQWPPSVPPNPAAQVVQMAGGGYSASVVPPLSTAVHQPAFQFPTSAFSAALQMPTDPNLQWQQYYYAQQQVAQAAAAAAAQAQAQAQQQFRPQIPQQMTPIQYQQSHQLPIQPHLLPAQQQPQMQHSHVNKANVSGTCNTGAGDGGDVDYSDQWIAYYEQLGMPLQADAIRKQKMLLQK